MRVIESKHKTKEQLKYERDQREGLLEYIEQMEEQYTNAKNGLTILEEDEKDFPDDKKDKTKEGEFLIYGIMSQREDDQKDKKWYAIGYTYQKQRAIESCIFINAMNNMVEPKYDIKIIAIKEKDWLEGYGASWQEPLKEEPLKEERITNKEDELIPVLPDEEPKQERTPEIKEEIN